MKTLIAIPCTDTVPTGFMESLLNLQKPEGTSVCIKPNSLIYDSRNLLSLTAIERGYDCVLWLDSDMMVPPYALSALIEDLETCNCGMVTGLYFKRQFPHTPVIFRHVLPPENQDGEIIKRIEEHYDYPRRTIFSVDGCGFGCCLTTTDLLKRVWDKFGPAFAPYIWAGEDISFCYRVKLLGERIFCDSRISCGHIGSYVFTEDAYKRGEQHG